MFTIWIHRKACPRSFNRTHKSRGSNRSIKAPRSIPHTHTRKREGKGGKRKRQVFAQPHNSGRPANRKSFQSRPPGCERPGRWPTPKFKPEAQQGKKEFAIWIHRKACPRSFNKTHKQSRGSNRSVKARRVNTRPHSRRRVHLRKRKRADDIGRQHPPHHHHMILLPLHQQPAARLKVVSC